MGLRESQPKARHLGESFITQLKVEPLQEKLQEGARGDGQGQQHGDLSRSENDRALARLATSELSANVGAEVAVRDALGGSSHHANVRLTRRDPRGEAKLSETLRTKRRLLYRVDVAAIVGAHLGDLIGVGDSGGVRPLSSARDRCLNVLRRRVVPSLNQEVDGHPQDLSDSSQCAGERLLDVPALEIPNEGVSDPREDCEFTGGKLVRETSDITNASTDGARDHVYLDSNC